MTFHQILRAAIEVGERCGGHVDAEVAVQRGVQLAVGDGPGDGFSCDPVGCPDDLARPHPAAGQQREVDLRPVIATHLRADLRRASELAQDDNGAILIESALVQVLDERADTLIEGRQILFFPIEDGVVGPAVPVPFAVIQRDDPDTGFEPSKCEECHVAYRAPAFFDDEIRTWIRPADLRRSSLRLDFEMRVEADDRLVADGFGVMVGYDYEAGKARTLPDSLRERIEPLLG